MYNIYIINISHYICDKILLIKMKLYEVQSENETQRHK